MRAKKLEISRSWERAVLIAEIRRKLLDLDEIAEADDPVGEARRLLSSCKEDLLTADVFGAVKYLPREYLASVLKAVAAQNSRADQFKEHLASLGASLCEGAFAFWPSYPNPEGMTGGSTEPDVEFAGPETLVFLEAKLHSGFGEQQIERQLLIGLEQARGREFFLILVTAGIRPPRVRLGDRRLPVDEYLRNLPGSGTLPKECARLLSANAGRVLWANWRSVFSAMERALKQHCGEAGARDGGEAVRCARDVLFDLRVLMEMRQLAPFEGIGRRARAVVARRPVFFPGAPPDWSGFRGFSAGALPELLALAPLSGPATVGGLAPSRGGSPGLFRSVVERRDPWPLPADWPPVRVGAGRLRFIPRIAARYQPESLTEGLFAFAARTRPRRRPRGAKMPIGFRAIAEGCIPMRLPGTCFGCTTKAAGGARRLPQFSCWTCPPRLPPGGLRLFRKGKQ